VAPRPGLLAEIPAAQRLPHDTLAKIGLTYYDALDDNDGSKAPFAADCERHENGTTTASDKPMGPPPGSTAASAPPANAKKPAKPVAPVAPVAHDCKGQMDSKSFTYIDRIENRRLIAADPVTGLAMGFSHFRHSMENLPYKVIHVDGSTTETNKDNFKYKPFDMPAAHIFKIGPEGQMHEIEAVGVLGVPYNAPTGWEK
jgi:hypothetical protein